MADEKKTTFTIGTRKSELAVVQSQIVQDALEKSYADYAFPLEKMSTIGDKNLDTELSKIGEKALFTKELEIALEECKVDLVVHSLKDLPTTLPKGMYLAAITKRDDPNDALVLAPQHQDQTLSTLPKGSIIGTSSVRRVAQLKRRYPHLEFKSVRGNLNTRLAKLDDPDGEYAGIILAVAGLRRIGKEDRISKILTSFESLHAVSQGALGVECREDDEECKALLKGLNHRETRLCCLSERSLMRELEGGCSVPIGVNSNLDKDGKLSLHGLVSSADGSEVVELKDHTTLPEYPEGDDKEQELAAEKLGVELAKKLKEMGAEAILKALRPVDLPSAPPKRSSPEPPISPSEDEPRYSTGEEQDIIQRALAKAKAKAAETAAAARDSQQTASAGSKRGYRNDSDDDNNNRYSDSYGKHDDERERKRGAYDGGSSRHGYNDHGNESSRRNYDDYGRGPARQDYNNGSDSRRYGLGSDQRRDMTSRDQPSGGEEFEEEVLIPGSMVGRIIGRGGEKIKEIQDQSGARVNISQDDRDQPTRRATVRGSKRSIEIAREMIEQEIKEMEMGGGRREPSFGGGGGYGGRGGNMEVMEVQSGAIPAIIGRGGENINDLQGKTQTRIKIDKSNDGRPMTSIEITGTPDRIEEAKRLIRECEEGANTTTLSVTTPIFGHSRGGGGGGRYRNDRHGGRNADRGSYSQYGPSYGGNDSYGYGYSQQGQQYYGGGEGQGQSQGQGQYDYSQYYGREGQGQGQNQGQSQGQGQGQGQAQYDYSQYPQQYYSQYYGQDHAASGADPRGSDGRSQEGSR